MHSVSHLLNDWGLEFKHKGGKFVFQEKLHVFMPTVFVAKMLKGRSQEKGTEERNARWRRRERSGPLVSPKNSVIKYAGKLSLRKHVKCQQYVWWCKCREKGLLTIRFTYFYIPFSLKRYLLNTTRPLNVYLIRMNRYNVNLINENVCTLLGLLFTSTVISLSLINLN